MRSLGDEYEERAASFIEDSGLRLLERNFRGKTGEIDIVALDGAQLVFVEVRARSNRFYTSAAGSIDTGKQRRIVRTAQLFLQCRPQWSNMPCRFDVVTFEPPQSGSTPRINWIRSAFTA